MAGKAGLFQFGGGRLYRLIQTEIRRMDVHLARQAFPHPIKGHKKLLLWMGEKEAIPRFGIRPERFSGKRPDHRKDDLWGWMPRR